MSKVDRLKGMLVSRHCLVCNQSFNQFIPTPDRFMPQDPFCLKCRQAGYYNFTGIQGGKDNYIRNDKTKEKRPIKKE